MLTELEVIGADGVEGTVAGIIAPLPAGDIAEGPIAFMAVTLAKTLAKIVGRGLQSRNGNCTTNCGSSAASIYIVVAITR